MAKKTLKGKTTFACDFDKKNRVYNCWMPKLKQKEKPKTPFTGEWRIPKLDKHEWNTETIRFHSEVKLPDPFGGVMSTAGGTIGGLIPSGTYLECKTGLKSGRFSLTKCTFKRE